MSIDRLGWKWVLTRGGRNLEEGTDRMGWEGGGSLTEPLYDMCKATLQGRRSESRLSIVRVGRRGEGWVLMKMGGRGLDPAWHISGVEWDGGRKGGWAFGQ